MPESDPEPEEISVVVEYDKPTGRLVHDEGDEEYRNSIAKVFPFAVVDFNKSEIRETGISELGFKEFVKPADKNEHLNFEP